MKKQFNIAFNRSVFFIGLFFALIAANGCKPLYTQQYPKPKLVDNKPTRQAKILHKRLHLIAKNGFAIGHQDATAYGIGWEHSDHPGKLKSDIQEISGRLPAVYGFDISKIELKKENNIDDVPFETMRKLIIEGHARGGLITISWHADNPVSGGDSWDKTPAVKDMLYDENTKQIFELWIDRVAAFIKTLKYKGKAIPVVFRPWHEMNGAWFWWGDPNCTSEEYIALWKRTVHLLRDKHKLHNLLYTYSPNKLNPDDDYLKYYPGDDYVDILGIDIYDFNNAEDYIRSLQHDLKIVKDLANAKNKLFAFTETGLEKIPTSDWFTKVLYPNLEDAGISWVLFWRNARKNHHYVPYKGHPLESDFKTFESFPKTLFLIDVKNLTN